MPLSPPQIALIKATVPVLQEHGTAITTTFYKNMLTAHPELNAIFNTANQATGHQQRALASALSAYASHIDNLAALSPTVDLICNKHASLGVEAPHYTIVGDFLLAAMADVLGDALTPDILAAWTAAYWQLADLMISREAELYRQAEGWTQFRPFRVVSKVPESDEITSFYLAPVDDAPLPKFRPGQYVSVQLFVPDLKYPQARQYSLSDVPRGENQYRISVRRDPGLDSTPGYSAGPITPRYVSNLLHANVQAGDVVKVSHPYGDFVLDEEDTAAGAGSPSPIVLLGAGVGLTPLMAMLNTLADEGVERRVSFVHGARTTRARAFKAYVQGLVGKMPRLRATFFTSHPGDGEKEGVDFDRAGRVAVEKLDEKKDLFVDDASAVYYVCGPEGFMADIKRGLMQKGVSAERIRMEAFGTGGVSA